MDGYTGGVVSLLLTLLGLVFAPIGQIAVQTGKLPTHEKAGGEGNVPSDFQSLRGCTNPNTGFANHDWGVGSNPVYVDPKSLTVGTPAYTTNVVFWISRETKPGQSVLLTGAFTHATKRVRLALIPPGSRDWQSIVRGSLLLVNATQQSIAIISGTRVGQYSFVKSYRGRTINLTKPWLVLPDTTSIAVLVQSNQHQAAF